MIITAADVERAIADDLRAMLQNLEEFHDLLEAAEPGEERDAMIVQNERLQIFLYGLPARIAERSPFVDLADVEAQTHEEVLRGLALLGGAEALADAKPQGSC